MAMTGQTKKKGEANLIILLTEHQAAETLAISVRTLQTWRCRGGGPVFIRLGRGRGAIRYRPEDLQSYLSDRLRKSTSDPGLGDRNG